MGVIYECSECGKQYEKFTTLCDPCLGARVDKKIIQDKKENTMDKKKAISFVYSLQKRLGSKDPKTRENFSNLVDLIKKGIPDDGQESLF